MSIVRGFIVRVSLPSRSLLSDHLRKMYKDVVPIKETVQLVPSNLIAELDNIRKEYESYVKENTVRLFGLINVLPAEKVEEFQKKTEEIRSKLRRLSEKIQKAIEGRHYKIATEYIKKNYEKDPRVPPLNLHDRMVVLLIPLLLSPDMVEEFMNFYYNAKIEEIKRRVQYERERLMKRIEWLKNEIERLEREREKRAQEYRELYERLRNLMKVERADEEIKRLEEKIQEYRVAEQIYRRKVNELARQKRELEWRIKELKEREASFRARIEEEMERVGKLVRVSGDQVKRDIRLSLIQEIRDIVSELEDYGKIKPKGRGRFLKFIEERVKRVREKYEPLVSPRLQELDILDVVLDVVELLRGNRDYKDVERRIEEDVIGYYDIRRALRRLVKKYAKK